MPPTPLRVAMLVDNPASTDARVLREASALLGAGYDVRLFAKRLNGFAASDCVDGIDIQRVWFESPRDRSLTWRWGRRLAGGGVISVALRAPIVVMLWLVTLGVSLVPTRWLEQVPPRAERRLFEPLGDAEPVAPASLGLGTKLAHALALALGKATRNLFVLPQLQDAVARWRPDVVHIHEIPLLAAGVETAKAVGARTVYDSHELHQHTHPPRPPLLSWWFALHERHYAPRCDAVITVSTSIAIWLERELALPAQPTVILNAPDIASVPPDGPRGLRDRLGLPNDAILTAYVGKIRPGRGLEEIIRALATDEHLYTVIVGPRDQATDEKLAKFAEKSGVGARVKFHPLVPHRQLVPFLREIDVGVVAVLDCCLSYRFSMPNKLFELIFAGVPVVAPPLPELQGFVTREDVGAIAALDDPKALAEAIRQAAEHPFGGDTQRAADLQCRYGWPVQAAKLQALYAKLGPT